MNYRAWFRTKSPEQLLADSARGRHQLQRSLGPLQLIALGVGAIIGAGLFSLTGVAAAEHAGPAVILSYLFASVGCVFAALCYSELVSAVPTGGSVYSFSYATMGEIVAWTVGWDLIIEHTFGAATIAVSWSRYLVDLLGSFGLMLPPQYVRGPYDLPVTLADGSTIEGIVNLPAIFIVCAVSVLLMHGISKSSRVNMVLTAIKIAIVLCFIGVGVWHIEPANYTPFIPPNSGTFGEFGVSGILTGAGIIFFSYLGFNVIATAAQEVKNPQRNMPIGIIGSLLVCTVVYLAFSAVLVGMVYYTDMRGDAAPVATAINMTDFPVLKLLVKLGIIAGFTSVIMVSLLGQSRVAYAMAADRMLPGAIGAVHPRWRTPWRLHLIFMVMVSLCAGLLPISKLGQMSSIGTLFAFILVCGGVLILRRSRPDLPRRFKVPLFPWVPIAGIVMCLMMMTSLHGDTWVRFTVWMALGLIIYFLYARPRLSAALSAAEPAVIGPP